MLDDPETSPWRGFFCRTLYPKFAPLRYHPNIRFGQQFFDGKLIQPR